MGQQVRLIKAGAVFTSVVSFDNLPAHAIGSLLCAVDPGLLWDTDVVTSLGGGKPFGWGAVTTDITDLHLSTARGRYVDEEDVNRPGVTDLVQAFRQNCGPAGWADDGSWESLHAVLQFGRFGDGVVWYPPGETQYSGSTG